MHQNEDGKNADEPDTRDPQTLVALAALNARPGPKTRAEAAGYIVDLLKPLAELARINDMKFLKFLIEMAALEANEHKLGLRTEGPSPTKRTGPHGA